MFEDIGVVYHCDLDRDRDIGVVYHCNLKTRVSVIFLLLFVCGSDLAAFVAQIRRHIFLYAWDLSSCF